MPTETVYGLRRLATSDAAVAEIFAAKGRPTFNPLIAHVAGAGDAAREAQLDAAGAAPRRALLAGAADAGRAGRRRLPDQPAWRAPGSTRWRCASPGSCAWRAR